QTSQLDPHPARYRLVPATTPLRAAPSLDRSNLETWRPRTGRLRSASHADTVACTAVDERPNQEEGNTERRVDRILERSVCPRQGSGSALGKVHEPSMISRRGR